MDFNSFNLHLLTIPDDTELPIEIRLLSTTCHEINFLNLQLAYSLVTSLKNSQKTISNHVLLHFDYQIEKLKINTANQIKLAIRYLTKEDQNQNEIKSYNTIFTRRIKRNWTVLNNTILTYKENDKAI